MGSDRAVIRAEPHRASRGGAMYWVPAAVSASAVVALAAGFLPHQCIWVDETIQLKGLTLGPVEVVRWLGGVDRDRFGVPMDNSPPLSYLVGKSWAALLGTGVTESSQRWLGVLLVALAAAVVTQTAGHLGTRLSALAAGLAFALSPNVVTTAVEIRAYPLFVLASACAFYAFVQLVLDPAKSSKWAVWLAIALIAAMYTHFYGLILAGSLGSVALATALRRRGPVRPILFAGIAVALAAIGLVPFVISSTADIQPGQDPSLGRNRLREVAQLVYRLFGHPAMATNHFAVAAAGVAVIVLCGTILIFRRERPAAAGPLAAALCTGFGVTVVAGLALRGFNVYSASYSLWMLPAFTILLSASAALSRPLARAGAIAGFAALLASEGYATWRIETNASLFAHGPARVLADLVRQQRGPVAVLHDEGQYGIAYFPLYYEFGGNLPQYSLAAVNPLRVVRLMSGPADPVAITDLAVSRLIVVRAEWQSVAARREYLEDGRPRVALGPIADALQHSPEWRLEQTRYVMATAGAAIQVFARSRDSGTP